MSDKVTEEIKVKEFLIGIDISSKWSLDMTAFSIMCSECGTMICLGTFPSGSNIVLRLPQNCPCCNKRIGSW